MLIGAHYYAWYHKRDWKKRTIRYYTKQQPALGWYDNVKDLEVVRTHFEQCKKYGIDFLLVSHSQEDLLPYLDIAEEVGIKIAAHCETLSKTKTIKIKKEHIGKLVFDAPILANWMKHPAWLRIDGKPAIAYYVTRQIVTEALPEVIKRLRESFGDCFLIGDEVWWTTPDKKRLKLFDAIYSYNMYINKGDKMDRGKVLSKGATGSEYLEMLRPYETAFFKDAREIGTKFFPTVLPGYNDRAVRYDVNHYAIPREDGLFFKQYLERSSAFLKDDILLVTSFNEWYEDSQIEAVQESEQLVTDKRNLTESTSYKSYNNQYLEILKEFKEKSEIGVSCLDQPLNTIDTAISNIERLISLSNEQLLDICAILYYQTTILPILEADNQMKQKIQKTYYQYMEEAARRKIDVKHIRQRIKEITHFFSCNRDRLLGESTNV